MKFIVNRECYLAHVDITNQGLTNHRPDQHSSICQNLRHFHKVGINPDCWLPPANTHKAAQYEKGLWTEFGSQSLITPLFAANKDLVSLCSGLGNRLSLAFKAPWLSFPIPPHPFSCSTASLYKVHPSGTEIWSVWEAALPLVLTQILWVFLETNENKIKTTNSQAHQSGNVNGW